MKTLTKSHNHDHFWIKCEVLYESYNTIRGMRFRAIGKIPLNDKDRLTDEDIRYIENNHPEILTH